MKIHNKKTIFNKKTRIVLTISVLILVFVFMLYQHNICYTYNFVPSSLSEDKDSPLCYRGEDTIITVRMLNSSDPIIGEATLFYDQSNGLLIGGEYTNSSGYAVLDWGIPSDYPLGLTTIKAECPNRPDAIPVYTDLFIKAKTIFENLAYPISAYPGEYLAVEVDLRDNINVSISNQQVYLYDYQNTNLNESTTDTFGHCRLSWEIPPGTTPGEYSFKVKFESTQLYSETEREFNVTIMAQSLEIVSITLNATRVKPNTPILISVELNYSDPFILVIINNDSLLVKAEGNTWKGTINTPSIPGKYALNVFVFYNGTQRINDSSAYYIVEDGALDFSAVAFLPFLSEGDSLTSKLTILTPISALSIISAVIAWKRKTRQPSFSRDYTVGVGSNS